MEKLKRVFYLFKVAATFEYRPPTSSHPTRPRVKVSVSLLALTHVSVEVPPPQFSVLVAVFPVDKQITIL